ncbi:MAG: Flp pilus assembly complex ATPase component TadA [Succinivibrio sp.]|nr:Flp pilus assembly complex ATPase component TadA [Succinivibrio sp.]
MYTEFFSLSELPFDGLPDQRFYYVGNTQHQALDLLLQNLSRSGAICVLSGPSGCGKTTMIRMLMRSLPTSMRIVSIEDPRLDAHMLLATILRSCGVVATSFESIAELTLKLRRLLEKSLSEGRITTVILDEAQGLSDEVIEQIRLVSNIECSEGKMINFLLAGQEDLIAHLSKNEHKMFWGRVRAFAELSALKKTELQSYISFRLQQAGCHEPLFSQKAISAIYRGSNGLPRLINSIADRALELTAKVKRSYVTGRIARRAVREIRYGRGILSHTLRRLCQGGRNFFVRKLPVALLGFATAAAAFALAYFFLPHLSGRESLQLMVQREESVQKAHDELLRGMLRGRSTRTKESELFNISVREAVFRSDAVDTLIKIWGYRRADDEKTRCQDLASTNLRCETLQGNFEEMTRHNRPAVLSLRDDSLNPFYGVLLHLSSDGQNAELIVGNRLWAVKTSYLKHVFDGEYEIIRTRLPRAGREFSEEELSILAPVFERIFSRAEIFTHITTRKELQAAMKTFYERYPERRGAQAVFDAASKTGPYLLDDSYQYSQVSDGAAQETVR